MGRCCGCVAGVVRGMWLLKCWEVGRERSSGVDTGAEVDVERSSGVGAGAEVGRERNLGVGEG